MFCLTLLCDNLHVLHKYEAIATSRSLQMRSSSRAFEVSFFIRQLTSTFEEVKNSLSRVRKVERDVKTWRGKAILKVVLSMNEKEY